MFPSRGGAHTGPEELFAGRYAVDGALPWGGLCTYYRAAAEGSPLILCVLPMDVSRSIQAEAGFSELAQRLGAMRSRFVPPVLDAGVIDGVPYLAFRDTRGTLLSDLLRDRTLGSAEVLRLGAEVLEALDAGHSAGLTHGDLNPHNILIARERNGRFAARVIGFGLLPLLRGNPEASAHAAHTGSGAHAVSYMAPELFGGGVFDGSADLYSVGALLHHMTTGAPPAVWQADEGFDDMPGLRDVIRRAMEKQPVYRYPSAASMRAALDWVEIESAQNNPETQDIAPWMEVSHVGSVPVPMLNTSRPPAHASSSHPVGRVLSTSGARPIPIEPVVLEEIDPQTNRRLIQIALLLTLLAALMSGGYWLQSRAGDPQRGAAPTTAVERAHER